MRADLSADAIRRLTAVPTPAQWNLPAYTDELQAQQACRQEAHVNERLRRRNLSIERANVGTVLALSAETPDGIDLGGAVLVVTKDKSRWIAYKSDPATSKSIDSTQSAQQRTYSASDGPQTLHGVDLAAAVIRFILHHRPGRRDRVLTFPSLAAQMRQPTSQQFPLPTGRSATNVSLLAHGPKAGMAPPKPTPPPQPTGPRPNSTFNAEGLEIAGPGPETSLSFQNQVRDVLKQLDDEVTKWWISPSISGLVRARDISGWFESWRSGVLTEVVNKRPIITVGKNFTADQTAEALILHPPIVKRLHYVMDGWLGDELLEGFPVFVMTKRLYTVLSRAELTGAHADIAEVTLSDEFHELFPNLTVPPFAWLKITGHPGVDDLGIAADHRLVVSSRALDLLNLKHAVIAAFPSAAPAKADKQ